jgi:hypothetical protein
MDLSIVTFSTDLLTMPAVPQDQLYAIEVQMEEVITTSLCSGQQSCTPPTMVGQFSHDVLILYLHYAFISIGERHIHHHAGVANDEQLVRGLCVSGSGCYCRAFGEQGR